MSSISVHVNDDVFVQQFTPEAVAGGWPLCVNIEAFCGSGDLRHTYSKDQLSLHGKVADFRRFAQGILDALPPEVVESDESYEASEALLKPITQTVKMPDIPEWRQGVNHEMDIERSVAL